MLFNKKLISFILMISIVISYTLIASPNVYAETISYTDEEKQNLVVSNSDSYIQYRKRSKIYKVSNEKLTEPWMLYDTKSGSEHTGMRTTIAALDDSEEMSAMYSACRHSNMERVNWYFYTNYVEGVELPNTGFYATEEEFNAKDALDTVGYRSNGKTYYRYTYCTSIDYYTDYYYYMWSDWTEWGLNAYTPDDDTEVETRKGYIITYDANGGVATPDEQFKIMDEELRLASTMSKRDEYVFMGWATSSTGEVEYNAGDTYSVNANATLYAVWKPISECETIKTYYRYSYKFYEEPTTEWRGEYWLYKTETKYEHGDFKYVTLPSVGYSTVGYCIHDKIYVNKYVNKYNSGQWFYATPSEFMNMDGTTVLSYASDGVGYYKFQYCTSKTPYEVYYYYSWSDWSNWISTPIDETDDVIVETKTVALFPITYDANGGSDVPAQQYKKSDESITLTTEIPTKENHLFLGWSTSPEGNVEYAPGTEYFANEGITLYAVWQNMTKYTITYDANGGTGAPTPQTNTYGESTEISSEIPTRENHQFLGWTTSAGGSVEYIPGSQYSNNVDVTLYAVWKNLSKYTITYDANGGLNAPVEQIKPHAENITLSIEIPTRENHQFLGWATSADGKVKYLAGAEYSVNANITLYAVWEKIYTITYDANGGSDAPASQTKTHNVDLTLSNSKPTKEGFTFIGWATSSEGDVAYQASATYSNNESITLYAQWKLTEYTITYDANGGSNAPASQTKTHDINLTLSDSKPTKEGFTFIGWATSSKGDVAYQSGDTYSNNESITLYAQWKVTEYTITYDANGGSNAPASQTKTHDIDLTLSDSKPTKDGHTFIGWATSVDGNVDYQSGDTYTTNESLTLFAKWDINTYTITFDANGGNEAPTSQVKTYGTDLVLNSNIPFRTGYTFQGWSTTKEGVVEYLPGGIYSLESNNTLYAIWGTGVSEIASGDCGENITWILYNDGTLVIDGSGGMYDYEYGNDPWDGNKSNIKHIEISEGVTRIGNYAFYGCSRFSIIDLPNTLTGIGEKSFAYCSSLVNITLPGNLKWIGRYAFSTCRNLSSIVIPDTVQQISEHAFEYCENMTSIRLPFYLQYPYIHEETFYGCSSLTDVTLPENLEKIGISAFQGCTSLKTVTVPKTVTYIGDYAFYGCRNLVTIYYVGTSEEWKAIQKGTNWDYNAGKNTAKKTYEVTRGTYVISYDANGGEGAPSSQTKIQGVEMALSDAIPTRTGYTFHGWSMTPNGSVEYQAGDLYTKNFDTILYAVWRNTYTISYDANGGTGAPSVQTKNYNESVTLSLVVPTREGYIFKGWSTNVDGYVVYEAGAICSRNADITLYAVWETDNEASAIIASGICGDNSTWVLREDGTLTVGGTGNMYNWSDSGNSSPWVNYNIREKIKKVIILNGVSNIGAYAFKWCKNLTSITIPASVTSIGEGAFYQCYGLTDLSFPKNLTSIGREAFYQCKALKSLIIPDSVSSINYRAFYQCNGLKSISISDSVASIGSSAFYECTGLTGVYITDVEAWCNITFSDWSSNPLYYAKKLYLNGELITDLTIPDSVTHIGKYAFYRCFSLKSVTIPDSVKSIGTNAFDSCSGLERVNITDIEAWCNISFGGAYSNPWCYDAELYLNGELVTDLIIPDSITNIGNYMFYDCSGLKNVTIPNGVTSIGDYAFYCCTELTNITIPDGVTRIGDNAFRNCSGLTSVTIPESVTWMGAYAFDNCTGLKRVNISDVEAWCNISFANGKTPLCYANELYLNGELVTNLVIPDGVTSVGGYAFEGYVGLTSVTIPESVTNIGYCAFYDCTNLSDVYFKGSKDEWKAISIVDGNTNLKNANIHYNVANVYTVTYNVNGGENAPSFQIKIHDVELTLSLVVPTREGYTFEGWSTSINGDVVYEAGDVYSGNADITLYAVWGIKTYIVAYNANGGMGEPSVQDKIYDEELTLSSVIPTREGYTFKGWATDATGEVKKSLSISGLESAHNYDNYTDKSWTVSCSSAKNISLTFDTSTVLESNYDYLYIYDSNGDLFNKYSGTTLAGKTITVDGEKITLRLVTDSSVNKWGFAVTSAIAELYSYKPGDIYSTNEDVTFYAVWEKLETYNVIYNANGGIGALASQTKIYNENLTLSSVVPTREGYTFKGWSTSVDGDVVYVAGTTYSENADVTLYAVWRINTYTITYDSNGGTGAPSVQTKNHNESVALSSVVPTRDGYTFKGWSTSVDGDVVYVAEAIYSANENAILYAVWELDEGASETTKTGFCGDNLTWVLSEDGTLTISGTGAMYDWGHSNNLPPWSGSGMINHVVINEGVTHIGNYAFYMCGGLTSVKIPRSVTNIGSSAFDGCSKLSGVYIEDVAAWCNIKFKNYYSNPLYYAQKLYLNGELVTELTIPSGVKSIGELSFYRCKVLTSVTISDSVTKMGENAFYACTGLTSVTIPDSITSIGEWVFNGCTGLKSVAIPSEVTMIGNGAFYGCVSLKDIYYSGTADEWKLISIRNNNTPLENANIHYNAKPTLHVNTVSTQNNQISLEIRVPFGGYEPSEIYIAIYDSSNVLQEVKSYPSAEVINTTLELPNGAYGKVMLWNIDGIPLTDAVKVEL